MKRVIATVMMIVILLASVLASVQAKPSADIIDSHNMYYSSTTVPTVRYRIPGWETMYQAWATTKTNPYRAEITRCSLFLWIPVDCLIYVLYEQNVWYQESTDFPASRWEPSYNRVILATDQYFAKKFWQVTHTGVVRCVGGLVCVVEEEGFPYPPPGGEGMRAAQPTPTDAPVIKSKKTKVPAYP